MWKHFTTELLVASPTVLVVVGALVSLVTATYTGLLFSGWALAVELINVGLKALCRALSVPGGERPCAAPQPGSTQQPGAAASTTTCDANAGCTADTFGMPSGHAQVLVWAATFATLWSVGRQRRRRRGVAARRNAAQQQQRSPPPPCSKLSALWWQLPIIWLLCIAVCAQRVVTNCHSVGQVLAGAVVGGGLGVGSYVLSTMISDTAFPRAW